MPGRQRSIARKVSEFEARLDRFGHEFYKLVPKLYLERAQQQAGRLTPVNVAWCDTLHSLRIAYQTMGELRRMLEERVSDLPEPEPCPYVSSTIPGHTS